MEDIEDFNLFGINIGGGKQGITPKNYDDPALLAGVLGGMIFGFNIAQLIGTINDIEYQNKIQQILRDYEGKRDLKEKLQNIKQKIESGSEIDVYGGILILFSELEKTVDQLYVKYIRRYDKPDTFKEKIIELENRRIISSVESGILRNEIYPKRNMISHGKYQNVNKKEVIACYEFVSQFINKYYVMAQ